MPDRSALAAPLGALLASVAAEVFQGPVVTEAKGGDGRDLVTSVDFAAQKALSAGLQALLPRAEVRGEEGYTPAESATRPLWLIDPLDGTVNFVAGLPAYAIAVALIEDGRASLAAVYDIPHGDTYLAVAGQGATLNGAALGAADTPARLGVLSSGLLADLSTHSPATLTALLADYKLRNFGSQALHLCYAAAGRVRFVASREAKAWDDLAGALVAQEAGLRYGHYGPMPAALDADQHSLCATPALFDTLAQTLALSKGFP